MPTWLLGDLGEAAFGLWFHTWAILRESGVYILAGFGIAGLLDLVLSANRLARYLPTRGVKGVVGATLLGMPLPLCSCSVLPTAVTLRKRGAGKGTTLSFLISTPETSVTSILLTYALLGPALAVLRPAAACLTALSAGLIENALERGEPTEDRQAAESREAKPACQDCCEGGSEEGKWGAGKVSWMARLRSAGRYAYVVLFDDLFWWVMLGVIAAAGLQVWMPPELTARTLGGTWGPMLLMLVIGVPLYVCAEASTPIAAALIAQGMSPGAALVLLLVGPATNLGSLGVLARHLGRRAVAVYLATITLVALVTGAMADALLRGGGLAARALDEPLLPDWLKTLGAAAFLFLGMGTLWRGRCMGGLVGRLTRRGKGG